MSEAEGMAYKASYTGAQFHKDNSYVRGIIGPIGSGKSVTCIMEILKRAMQQAPDKNNFRKTRCAVVRNSKPELRSTTIKTFQDWIPPSVCNIVSSEGLTHGTILTKLPDGTFLDCEVIFMGLDKPADVKKLLSLELTFAFVNEAREIQWEIVAGLKTRLTRYPSQKDRPPHILPDDWPTFSGMWMDTNPPDTDSWWYNKFEVEKDIGFKVFHQPPAMLKDPETGMWHINFKGDEERGIRPAENLKNLKPSYYPDLVKGQDESWIKVMVGAEYGILQTGKPVFPRFDVGLHVAKEPLQILRGVPLILGSDNGRNGVTLIAQVDPRNGQLRVLRELVRPNLGVRAFASEYVKPMLYTDFYNLKVKVNYTDPAANNKNGANEDTEIIEWNQAGIPSQKASTSNAIAPRLEAVGDRLNKVIQGQPALIVDPSCRQLIAGMSGKYVYKRVQVSGEEVYRDIPDKNKYADSCDALQYICVSIDSMYAPTNAGYDDSESLNTRISVADVVW